MQIRQAEVPETEAVLQFYSDLIDDMAVLPYHPRWTKGVYPEDPYLIDSVAAGQLYIAVEDGCILGAMIVNREPNEGYSSAAWPTQAKDGEYTMLHTLGVAVRRMRSGIGSAMVRRVIQLAANNGQKAVRLDVIEGNFPARNLYEHIGFQYVQTIPLFYEDTGWCNFDLYEYPL